jgi:hypothetical protein
MSDPKYFLIWVCIEYLIQIIPSVNQIMIPSHFFQDFIMAHEPIRIFRIREQFLDTLNTFRNLIYDMIKIILIYFGI